MKLRYIIIKVKNINRAKEFYNIFLEQKPIKEEGKRMVVYDLGNIKIGLYSPAIDGYTLNESDFGTSPYPSFGVDNINVEFERVSKFAKIISQKKSGTHEWFEFEDTEGNLLEMHKI